MREPAYNSWSLKAWIVGAPCFALLAGAFFDIPGLLVGGAAALGAQALYMIATGHGVSERATVTGRQAGVMFLAVALAALGFGLTRLRDDEGWMLLVLPLAAVLLVMVVLSYQGRVVPPMFKRRWMTLVCGLWVVVCLVAAAFGALT